MKSARPETIREFKHVWLKERYHSYSDGEIKHILQGLLIREAEEEFIKTHLS